MAYSCGVDFGTSNSTVGWHPVGVCSTAPHASLLALEDDKSTLPSVIFFNADEDEVSYGRAALSTYLAGYEGRLMRSMKSLLGTALMEGQTEVQGRALPFKDLLAQFISELKRRAERSAGQQFTQAVFGRPVHFIDDNHVADQLAQDTLEQIARAAGFTEVQFQFEPIAAAFDYESRISKEELVLIADIGGGTSDFSLVRLSPERRQQLDRRDDILGNGGVHIGGTDFDKYLSLAHIMPLLGLGGRLATQIDVPSGYYFNLATWHTINLAYTKKIWSELQDVLRDINTSDLRQRFDRLLRLIEQRDGHWLAIQAEDAKIALSSQDQISLTLDRLRGKLDETACILDISKHDFQHSVEHLSTQITSAVQQVLSDAGIAASAVDTVFFTGGSSGVIGLRDSIGALVPTAKKIEGDLFGSIGTGLGIDAARRFA